MLFCLLKYRAEKRIYPQNREAIILEKPITWTQYLDTKVSRESYAISQQQCGRALSYQRNIIGKLVRSLEPKTIACMGSGFLNDLPIRILFSQDTQVTLVDWIEGISQEGVSHQIISKSNDEYHCLFCDKNIGNAYCKNFTNELLTEGVCTAFVPVDGPSITCQNYEPNAEPKFLQCDITAGYGNHFANAMQKKINSCKTPKEVFTRAIKLCSQLETRRNPIPVEDNSIDLVTSSMVLSQFDYEPYNYFAQILEQCYGRDQILAHEKVLRPLMEELRTKLFVEQARRHTQELYRLAKKDGTARVYLSVELFRSDNDDSLYFLVQDISKALDIINEYFLFDLEAISRNDILHHVDIDNGTSVIQNYVLVPRTH